MSQFQNMVEKEINAPRNNYLRYSASFSAPSPEKKPAEWYCVLGIGVTTL
jgi:hypothetical protein